MQSTSVEDFQDYHIQQPTSDIAGFQDVSPKPEHEHKKIRNCAMDDDEVSLSGSGHHSSSQDEAVFDRQSHGSSPRTSSGSEDDISVLESHIEPDYCKPSTFTPAKTRAVFRNPSSVRAMQMDTTPPHLASPSAQQRTKYYTPSRQGTPRSARSHRSAMGSPSKLSPTKKLRKEYPLVLLHVTLLPIPLTYSQEVMESVLPSSVLENWKILQEKATDTVLERGVLIPHPREDYDLFEERLLESLELKMPRILKCGHFHLSPEEEADIVADSDNEDADSDADDLDICLDCGRRIRDGKFGSTGTGSKRWDIKLFAANGLMRAGAWSAAWREMERVDVEILPWMEEDMKRELDLRKEEEERARLVAREEGVGGLDDERLREIYGGDAQAFVDGFMDERSAAPEQPSPGKNQAQVSREDIPLWDLFRIFLCHAVQDRRNIAIFFLSLIVLCFSMGSFSNKPVHDLMQPHPNHHSGQSSHVDLSSASRASQHTGESPPSSSTISVPKTGASTSALAKSPSPEPEQSEELGEIPKEEEVEEVQPSSWLEAAEEVVGEMVED